MSNLLHLLDIKTGGLIYLELLLIFSTIIAMTTLLVRYFRLKQEIKDFKWNIFSVAITAIFCSVKIILDIVSIY